MGIGKLGLLLSNQLLHKDTNEKELKYENENKNLPYLSFALDKFVL